MEGLTQFYKSAGSKLESSTFYLSRAQTAAQVINGLLVPSFVSILKQFSKQLYVRCVSRKKCLFSDNASTVSSKRVQERVSPRNFNS